MKRTAAVAVLALLAVSAPAEAKRKLTHAESVALFHSGPCHEAVDEIMPEEVRAFFHKIVNRESGGREWATNTNKNGSTDGGCLQINSIHGVPNSCRLEARCNVQFALKLYKKVGTSPWRATR